MGPWLLPPDKWEACVENHVILLPTCFTRALLSSAEKIRLFVEYLELEGTREDHEVQLLALLRTPQRSHSAPGRRLVQTLLEALGS